MACAPSSVTTSNRTLDAFLAACKKYQVRRPNPILVRLFTDAEVALEDLEELDLKDNYLGNRGVMALLDVIRQAPHFRTLDLSGQKIYNTDLSDSSIKGNEVMEEVITLSRSHPGLTALDLSGNPISNFIGRKLLALVESNPRICNIGVQNTRLDFELRGRIKAGCEANTRKMWEMLQEEDNAAAEDAPFGEFGAFGGRDAGSEDHRDSACPSSDTPLLSVPSPSTNNLVRAGDAGRKFIPDLTTLGGGKRPRKTVMAAALDMEAAKSYQPPVYEKSEEQMNLICSLLQRNVLFAHLDTTNIKTIAKSMQRVEFPSGTDVLVQNEEGNTLYVIEEGTANILKEGQCVFVKHAGTAFGELELMYDAPCAATVRVVTERMVCWALDRATYRNLVMGAAIRRREEHMEHVAAVPIFQDLSYYEKMQIADALSSDEWFQGDEIIRYGQDGEWMFLILEGTVEVIGRENGEPKVVCEFTRGEFFGELEFLNNHLTVADVRATTYVRTAKVNRRHFEMCMGPIMDVLKRNTDNSKYVYYKNLIEKEQTHAG